MIITYHQLHTTDPANPSLAAFEQSFEHLKDGLSGSVRFLAFPSSTFNREDFPIPIFADAQSDKQREVTNPVAPPDLEIASVKDHVGEGVLDGTFSPPGDFIIESLRNPADRVFADLDPA